MLTVENLNVRYGAIRAIKGVSLKVGEGEIVSLIGANGAGKTTTLHAISGLLKYEGSITFMGSELNSPPTARGTRNKRPDEILSMGLAQAPEGRRVFASLTVEENLELGAYLTKNKKIVKSELARVMKLFPRLAERKKQPAGTLSGGEQQMLAIGRALMSRPKTLLLDEPSMGLSPILVKEIFNIIKECNENGATILLVEQNAKMALAISKRAYVLETGKIALSGDSKELMQSDEVKKAYLGG
jgi:branched-chain amino acid transport system ATP-binding protein